VPSIVLIAGRYKVPLYPISRGRNWGYGDACPVTEGQALLDLSDLQGIEVNDRLAYAVIEPGVTQKQLFDRLERSHPRLWMDATGSGLHASVLGNSVERGFGHTPFGDHFAHTCGMEVVLADGTVLQTGMGHYGGSRLAHTYKWGIGPSLDGLFSQSNLGVVTRVGLWLMPRPQRFEVFVASVGNEQDFESFIERLRPLRQSGVLQSTVHISNDLRTLSSARPYPLDLTGGRVPIPAEVRAKLLKHAHYGAWSAVGALYGTPGEVRARRQALEQALRGLGRVRYITSARLRLLKGAARLLKRAHLPGAKALADLAATAQPVYDLLRGKPSDFFLQGPRWRARTPSPTSPDPLDSNCGFYTVAPLAAMTGEDGRRLLDILYRVIERHRFDPMISITLLNGRAMACVTTLYYDRSDEEESKRARLCYDDLLDALMKTRFIPYRMGIESMDRLDPDDDTFWQLVGRLKEALDPGHVLAPGRYNPAEARIFKKP
jgi:4-cresol dehydrogenase (hydroxylating)